MSTKTLPLVIDIITRTKLLDENIVLLNSIPLDLYKELLNQIQFSKELQDNYNHLAEQYGFEKKHISSIIETICYLQKQLSIVLMNPSDMKKFLIENLKIEEIKSLMLVDSWTDDVKNNFDLENKKKLLNISWEINTQASSTFAKKESSLNASIQLNFADKNHEDLTLKLDKEEIIHLYNALEHIQTKLDSI